MNEEQSITDCSHNNKSKNKLKNTNTKDVTFQWDEEESESEVVYLTGSFCNWKQFFIMPKIDDKYSITLPLPKALHKFKFRINEDYKLNDFVIIKNEPIEIASTPKKEDGPIDIDGLIKRIDEEIENLEEK